MIIALASQFRVYLSCLKCESADFSPSRDLLRDPLDNLRLKLYQRCWCGGKVMQDCKYKNWNQASCRRRACTVPARASNKNPRYWINLINILCFSETMSSVYLFCFNCCSFCAYTNAFIEKICEVGIFCTVVHKQHITIQIFANCCHLETFPR